MVLWPLKEFVQFGASCYDPEVGRWTSKDPILLSGGGADLFGYIDNIGKSYGIETNLYGYSFSDPLNFTDSEGLAVPPPEAGPAHCDPSRQSCKSLACAFGDDCNVGSEICYDQSRLPTDPIIRDAKDAIPRSTRPLRPNSTGLGQ